MADLTAQVRQPPLAGQAMNYVAVTAADFFTATPNASYIIHWKNGATATASGNLSITDPTTPVPQGSTAVAGFADAVANAGGLVANGERISRIPNSDRFRDSNGRINLVHGGTITTLTVAILGPFPA